MLSPNEAKQFKLLKKRVDALEKERYTVEQIKQDMHNIIVAVVSENIEIEISTDDQIKELINA